MKISYKEKENGVNAELYFDDMEISKYASKITMVHEGNEYPKLVIEIPLCNTKMTADTVIP